MFVEETPGRLDDRALATRLALFLWNSIPDDTLRTLADRGELSKPAVYDAQVKRMLADPKSDALIERAEAGLKYNIFVRARSQTIWKVTTDLQEGLQVGTWTREAAVQAKPSGQVRGRLRNGSPT